LTRILKWPGSTLASPNFSISAATILDHVGHPHRLWRGCCHANSLGAKSKTLTDVTYMPPSLSGFEGEIANPHSNRIKWGAAKA
jgi:hypothetical protein